MEKNCEKSKWKQKSKTQPETETEMEIETETENGKRKALKQKVWCLLIYTIQRDIHTIYAKSKKNS